MRIQLRAILTIEDEQELIETAKERAEVMGGTPELIRDAGAALIELFDLVDYQGNSTGAGYTLIDLESVRLCDNEECYRKEHR